MPDYLNIPLSNIPSNSEHIEEYERRKRSSLSNSKRIKKCIRYSDIRFPNLSFTSSSVLPQPSQHPPPSSMDHLKCPPSVLLFNLSSAPQKSSLFTTVTQLIFSFVAQDRTATRLHLNLSIIATHSESNPANKPRSAKKCLWVQLAEMQMHKQGKIRTKTKTPPLSKVVRSPFLAGSGL